MSLTYPPSDPLIMFLKEKSVKPSNRIAYEYTCMFGSTGTCKRAIDPEEEDRVQINRDIETLREGWEMGV